MNEHRDAREHRDHEEDDARLARALTALRSVPPPRSGDALRAALHRRFATRVSARRRAPRLAPRFAAAAGVLVALALALRSSPRVFEAPLAPDGARLARLADRLTRIEGALAARTAAAAAPRIALDDERVAGQRPVLELAGGDPALLRLITADRIALRDPRAAAERYVELIEDFAASPAADAARVRLAAALPPPR
jgi:hypothetical protein